MEMKHTTPHFIALAVLTIGLPWFFLLSDEDHRLLPSLFIVGGAVAVLALDFFGPAARPIPLPPRTPSRGSARPPPTLRRRRPTRRGLRRPPPPLKWRRAL